MVTGPVPQRPDDPYAEMTDEQVLARARNALVKASTQRAGSIERAITWSVFDSAMMELGRRAMRHIVVKLAELEDE